MAKKKEEEVKHYCFPRKEVSGEQDIWPEYVEPKKSSGSQKKRLPAAKKADDKADDTGDE